MPDRATCDIDGFLSHGLIPLNCDGLAKCPGIAGENPLSAPSSAIDKMRRVLRNLIPPAIRAGVRFPRLPLLRHGAQIVIARTDMPAICLP